MTKTALLFPGQGAQYAGMGRDFYENNQAARSVFERAAQALDYDLTDHIFSGQGLEKTEITQPAIITTSLAIYESMRALGFDFDVTLGLSLGEYASLVASQSLVLEDALRLVAIRGKLMQQAVPQGVGGMTAVVGLALEEIEAIVDKGGKDLWIANYNCPGQVVLSGKLEALEEAGSLAQKAGAKLVSRLAVSAPFHTPLLSSAAQGLQEALAEVDLQPPQKPIFFNLTARRENDPLRIKELLVEQVKQPVLFWQSLEEAYGFGVRRYVEVGPQKTLKGFVKRSLEKPQMISVAQVGDLERIQDE